MHADGVAREADMSYPNLGLLCITAFLCALVNPAYAVVDCNANGVPDDLDIAVGSSLDCNENLIPDECELVLWQEQLRASDAENDDRFGSAIALDGETMMVGAPWEDSPYASSGAVYVYRREGATWIERQKLTASDAVWLHNFGGAIALDGAVAVIGAIHDNQGGPEAGAAYVFRWDGNSWIEEQKLRASDARPWEYFGAALAVEDGLIAVGALSTENGLERAGAVYLYGWDGGSWIERQKLTASDASEHDLFGETIAIQGAAMLVGAPGDDVGTTDCGSVYAFEWDGSNWVQRQRLTASDALPYDGFGSSLDIDANVAAIGAPGDISSVPGAVYLFQHESIAGGTWILESKVTPADAQPGDYFGAAVDLDNAALAVGAPWAETAGRSSGAAYLYHRNGTDWIEQDKLIAADAAAGDWFGYALAFDGDLAAVGSLWGGVDDVGAAYLFHLPMQTDCNGNAVPDECDIEAGFSEDGNANGVPDECDCPADLDGDWFVGLSDLAGLLEHYGMANGAAYADGDLNRDGAVNLDDLADMLARFGTTCE